MCVANNKKDFIRPIKKTQNGKANRISRAMGITRSRKVRWSLIDAAGETRHIKLQCCHAPPATQSFLSTSVFCKACPKNSVILNPKSWTVQPDLKKLNKNLICINIDPSNNLPTARCICTDSLDDPAVCFSKNPTMTHVSNLDLDKPQKELSRWHHKSGHGNPQDIQESLQSGAPATTCAMRHPHKQVANICHHNPSKCALCMFGKQTNGCKTR